jgi:hypothetical protein
MNNSLGFTHGFVHRNNLIYVVGVLDDLDEQDVYHAIMLRWQDGKWDHWPIRNRIVSISAYDSPVGPTVMALGIDGKIHVSDNSGQHWETVDTSKEGPSRLRHLSSMRIIGNYVYVAGMQRQVYRRQKPSGTWRRFDEGVLVPRKSLEIEGFNSIDGLREDDIYAVGLHGQIWHYDGARWTEEESPTNVKLECVRCVSPDLVFVCGGNGIVIKGRTNRWETVNHEITKETFWGAAYLGDTLYLSTSQGTLFQLRENEMAPVDMKLGKDVSTFSLHGNDGIVLSIGNHDLCLFDGAQWKQLGYP